MPEENRNMCQEIEACRNLINQLEEEGRKQSPFNNEFVELKKLERYIKLLNRLQKLKKKEEKLLDNI